MKVDRIITGVLALLGLLAAIGAIILGTAQRVEAQPVDHPLVTAPCVPYDVTIQRLATAGWVMLEDVGLPEGFEADRLIVATSNGFAIAAPVVNGCVPIGFNIPLGYFSTLQGDPA